MVQNYRQRGVNQLLISSVLLLLNGQYHTTEGMNYSHLYLENTNFQRPLGAHTTNFNYSVYLCF